VLIAALSARLGTAVESVGWKGDALEARAVAYLAVRSRRDLPLSPVPPAFPRPWRADGFSPLWLDRRRFETSG
jgi:anhydro-N-acetylmuramic acid kinase